MNMNVMQPVYQFFSTSFTGYSCLGVSLFVGKFLEQEVICISYLTFKGVKILLQSMFDSGQNILEELYLLLFVC